MKEFIKELENNGVTNVMFRERIGCDKKSTLHFQINDKIFIIESLRGGDIIQGSFIVCDVITDTRIEKENYKDWTSDDRCKVHCEWVDNDNQIGTICRKCKTTSPF